MWIDGALSAYGESAENGEGELKQRDRRLTPPKIFIEMVSQKTTIKCDSDDHSRGEFYFAMIQRMYL